MCEDLTNVVIKGEGDTTRLCSRTRSELDRMLEKWGNCYSIENTTSIERNWINGNYKV